MENTNAGFFTKRDFFTFLFSAILITSGITFLFNLYFSNGIAKIIGFNKQDTFIFLQIFLPIFITLIALVIHAYTDAKQKYLKIKSVLISEEEKLKDILKKEQEAKEVYKKSLVETTKGFPSLKKIIDDYSRIQDELTAKNLYNKKHPAIKSAQIVIEESRKRRFAELEYKKIKFLLEYFEKLYPELQYLRNDLEADLEIIQEFNEEASSDESSRFLTPNEYNQLSDLEKHQRALDNYKKRFKNKATIGKLYERYVGYNLEQEEYKVEYYGIDKGFEDLGRDLICYKNDEVILIQCKHWARFKQIFENHIFQFFGTYYKYKKEFPSKKVKARFYTSTAFSKLAKEFAKQFKIELYENYKFDFDYPCIKCNVNNGNKIFHLPFDQQYDRTTIDTAKGDFYCKTVKEAIDNGFRRAKKHFF